MAANNHGYSGTPLEKKLGIKSGFKIRLINVPANYFDLFENFPDDISILKTTHQRSDLVHYFPRTLQELMIRLPKLAHSITPGGIIWVSWAKKSSGIITDIDGNEIRDLAIKSGLVDIKVCAVDQTWSALKLVIPLNKRSKTN